MVLTLYLLYLLLPIALLLIGAFGEVWTNTLLPTGLTTAQPARAGTAGGRARPSRRARPQPEAPPGVQAAVEAAP